MRAQSPINHSSSTTESFSARTDFFSKVAIHGFIITSVPKIASIYLSIKVCMYVETSH